MINWVDERLVRWGEWVQMGHGQGSKGLSPSWDGVGGGKMKESFIPIKNIEDSRCDDWVRSLSPDQQAILLEVYCTPHTAMQHSRVLKMSTRTLYARLHALQAAYVRRREKAPK